MPRAITSRIGRLERTTDAGGSCRCVRPLWDDRGLAPAQRQAARPSSPLCPHGRAWPITVRVVYDDLAPVVL